MIRSLLKLALLAVVCIVIYNYFFGDASEKAQSKRIFQGVGSVFKEVKTLVRSERDKFDAGKYDAALTKMQDVIERLKNHARSTNDANLQSQVDQLEKRQIALHDKVEQSSNQENTGLQKAGDKLKQYNEMAKQMESLTNDLQSLLGKVAPEEANQ
jgi:cytochrome c556